MDRRHAERNIPCRNKSFGHIAFHQLFRYRLISQQKLNIPR